MIAHRSKRPFLSMVGRFRKCENLSGFLYGIFLLLTLSANCSGNILNQTKAMLREMQHEAGELFNESVLEHDIPEDDCKRPYQNNTRLHNKTAFYRINESLIYFSKAFDVLLKRHTAEYKHTENLKEAKVKIDGLRCNLLQVLKPYKTFLENKLEPHIRKMLETKLDLPNSTDIYTQKLECCRLLNIYMDFLKVMHEIISKISTRRSKRHFFTT